MKHLLLAGVMLLAYLDTPAQQIRLSIRKNEQKEILPGAVAVIPSLSKTAMADSTGLVVFTNVIPGLYSIKISYIGMEDKIIMIDTKQRDNEILDVFLTEKESDEEVIVTATRISRIISDLPTRIETISGEELAEKGNMKPGDIRMLLNESTGIQTQQTSATSYNSSIRIQGLDGRYTQILRDGFPLYAGFSSGLSLMQTAPLDLKQIEVIKGSSSTLYGGGAIAGLVNLVSKTPAVKCELSFLLNGSSAGGLDISGFYSKKFDKIGITVFSSRNTAKAYDPAGIGFTAIPQSERYTISPRIFFYGNKTTANIGFNYVTENRLGGSMDYIEKKLPGFFEKNTTARFSTQAQLTHKLNDHSSINLKNSFSSFDRLIQIPSYEFNGTQLSSFSEATYNMDNNNKQWVVGVNVLTDDFKEHSPGGNAVRDYHYNTLGVFIQHTWSPVKLFTMEAGLRGDYVEQFGLEWLPRFSTMFRITPKLTMRIGGGLGYKTPSIFNEESEKIQFQHILPIDQNGTQNERSAGGNFDINFRTRIGELGFTYNQLFFYTRLNRPLILSTTPGGNHAFINAAGHIDTKGAETNVRLTYRDLKLFIGYTYADVNTHYNNKREWLPLTARHRLNNILMYEKEGELKIGLEAYFFSPQQLSDGSVGRPYWLFGCMAEKTWKQFSLFINFENITDTRQTKFDTVYTGPMNNPVFKDIYAPLDGFVINGGVKIRL